VNDEPEQTDEGWWLRAECRGLTTTQRDDLFFPACGDATAPAKAICAMCPVRAECLDYALTNGERFGIWGGLSERERRRIRRRDRATPPRIEHGTIAGAAAHRRAGERPCPDCLAAAARYQQDRRPTRARSAVTA
jgi:WhiB family redox-sensing transcriptional regulator